MARRRALETRYLAAYADTFRSVRWLRRHGRVSLDFGDLLVDARQLRAGLQRLKTARDKRARDGPKPPAKRRKAKGGGRRYRR